MKTSFAVTAPAVTLEPEYWQMLDDIAEREGLSRDALIGAVQQRRPANVSLSNALRVYVVSYYRAATPPGAAAADPIRH